MCYYRIYLLLLGGGTQNSEDGVYRQLWRKIQQGGERSLVNSTAAAMERLETEAKTVYLADKTEITQHRSKKVCYEGVLLPEEFHSSGFGLVFKQTAPYERRLNLM